MYYVLGKSYYVVNKGGKSMNEKITNTGGTEFDFTNYRYWLSATAEFDNVAYVLVESHLASTNYRRSSAKVRAMRTF